MNGDNELQKIKSDFAGKVPEPLLDLAISKNTPSRIAEICLENGVTEEKDVKKVGYGVGLVLLGQLPPDGLLIFIKKALNVDTDVAQKIYGKMDQVLLSGVKNDLLKLYGTGEPSEQGPEEISPKPQGPDAYHEPIE